MAFDVTQFELQDTAVMTVRNAKGDDDLMVDGKPVLITLFGSGSRQAVKAAHKAGLHAQARLQALVRGKTDKDAAEVAQKELVDKLVACTDKIENFPIEGGAQALYSNPKLGYITKQVLRFLEDDANFSKGSTTS